MALSLLSNLYIFLVVDLCFGWKRVKSAFIVGWILFQFQCCFSLWISLVYGGKKEMGLCWIFLSGFPCFLFTAFKRSRRNFMDQCVGSSFSRPLDLRQSWDAYGLVTFNWDGLDLSIPWSISPFPESCVTENDFKTHWFLNFQLGLLKEYLSNLEKLRKRFIKDSFYLFSVNYYGIQRAKRIGNWDPSSNEQVDFSFFFQNTGLQKVYRISSAMSEPFCFFLQPVDLKIRNSAIIHSAFASR